MRLGGLFSIIVFVAPYATAGRALFATAVAMAPGLVQIGYQKLRRQPIDLMAVLSLALVVVFGGLALIAHDGRFIMAKPSIIHFAIRCAMLRRGWMDRYPPAVAHDNLPAGAIIAAGYAWAALMFGLGVTDLIVADSGGRQTWALYITIVPLAAKLVAFGLQYALFRACVIRRKRAWRLATGAT